MAIARKSEDPNIKQIIWCQFLLAGVYFNTGRHENCLKQLNIILKFKKYTTEKMITDLEEWIRVIVMS
jgi:trans-2-enoyl-CoA reductase